MAPEPSGWVVLAVTRTGAGELWLEVSGPHGTLQRWSEPHPDLPLILGELADRFVPALPQRAPDREPPMLALFLWLDPGLEPLFPRHPVHPRAVVVALARRTWTSLPTWRLPLDIALVRHAQRASQPLASSHWTVSGSPFGVHLHTVADPTGPGPRPPEIVCVEGADLAATLAALAGETRVVLAFTSLPPQPYLGPVPSGVSLLLVEALPPDPRAGEFLHDFVLNLVHDLPLHEAAARAARSSFWLASDPVGLQALSMSSALEDLVADAIGVERRAGTIRRELTEALRQPVYFDRERNGLEPMTRMEAAIGAERRRVDSRSAAPPGANGEPPEARQVDIALFRTGVIGRTRGDPLTQMALDRDSVLARGRRYRLAVHVGHPTRASLVEGPAPPIDELLPRTAAGHELEIALYPLDFGADGPLVRPLDLPAHGSSDPVEFEVVAPDRDGPARLRVAVYYRNHLVQSWQLEGTVEAEERGGGRLFAELEFSRTERLDNLDDFGRRPLSMGLNQDPDGTHTIMVKAEGKAPIAFKLTESAIAKYVDDFRSRLEAATTMATGGPRFASTTAPADPPSASFDEVVRDLGRFGRQLFEGLIVQFEEMEELLQAVRASEDQVVQVVRLDKNRPFPWTAIYDFPKPPELGGAPAAVCHGSGAGRCAACPRADAWCTYGFWGHRHCVEELIAARKVAENAVKQVVQDPGRPLVRIVDGVDNQPAADVATRLGLKTEDVEVQSDLDPAHWLDALWDGNRRPTIAITVGPHRSLEVKDQPLGPRIELRAGKAWLELGAIAQRIVDHSAWSGPGTIVILLTCKANEAAPAVLNDFVLAFGRARAAAVVGTECSLHYGMLQRFARELVTRLAGGQALGAAVTRVRRDLAASGIPLGLAFCVFGPADLTIVKGGP